MQIFASLTSYNVTTMSSGHRFPAQPFEEYRHFIERHESYWDNMDTGALPYGPVVTVGWAKAPGALPGFTAASIQPRLKKGSASSASLGEKPA